MSYPRQTPIDPLHRKVLEMLGVPLGHVAASSVQINEAGVVSWRSMVPVGRAKIAELREELKPDAVRRVEELEAAGGVQLCRRSGPLTEGDAEAVLAFRDWLAENPKR